MKQRYVIINDSVSAHCCFEYTVCDTTKPVMIGGKHWEHSKHGLQYETVCECFDALCAKLVCDALNAQEEEE